MTVPPNRVQNTAILPLPEDVIAQIKSSTTVTSLNSVVFGLLENSLDAQATRIEVSVDFRRGGCSIEDNGLGIPPSEFRESGGLCRMYHTSKQNGNAQFELHGGQGAFLASVAALSQITTTSRHFQHFSHNTLTIHRAKPISRLTPAPAQHEIRKSASHGTRITVRDLFGNMPVRVKQRVMAAEEVFEVEKQWQALKKGIVALLLPWKNLITVKVSDAENSARNFSINTNLNASSNALSERNVNSLNQKSSSLNQSTVLSILAQSGFVSVETKDSWIPASASTLSVTVKGLISLEPAPSRTTQFISIGITPCLDENRHNELYDTVNRIFNQSSFGHIEDDSEPDKAELERRKHDRRYKKDGPTNKQIKGGRKGVDRWPRFYFRIELKNGAEAHTVNKLSDMRLRSIINVLEALTTQWLEANHFRPRKPRRKKDKKDETKQALGSGLKASAPYSPQGDNLLNSSASYNCNPLVRTASQAGLTDEQQKSVRKATQSLGPVSSSSKVPFTDWSRIKSANPQMYEDIWKYKSLLSKELLNNTIHDSLGKGHAPASEKSFRLNVEAMSAGQFGTGDGIGFQSNQTHALDTTGDANQHVCGDVRSQNISTDGVIEWKNPVTNEKHRIDARTGIVMPDLPRRPVSEDSSTCQPAAAANPQTSSFGKPLVLQRRKSAPANTDTPASSWLQGLLQSWKNPIFANQSEQAIPTAGFGGQRDMGRLDRQIQVADSFLQSGRADTSRLSKSALAHAQVISQVDRKFILMKMPTTVGPKSEQLNMDRQLLVLMDQHAASERCILETLLAELCTPAQDSPSIKSNLGLTSSITAVQLDTALQFQVSVQEEAMFKAHAAHFARWGILYDIHSTKPGTRLIIKTLPPGIHSRCTSSPKLIMELLREEMYNLTETSYSRHHLKTQPTEEKHSWLRKLGSCPKGILQLLNSRACRSAIMFNDKLEIEECEELVRKLGFCAFPFMCAHGRNSMVPLVYFGGVVEEEEETAGFGGFGGDEDGKREEGFVNAFKKWRSKT